MKHFSALLRRINPSLLQCSFRKLSIQAPSYEEIRIPVPWGHIAAKWWGPQDKRPILGCHGWQDNSGTFDRLVTYLPSDIGFLAIDFPGHGLSSPLPPGMHYHGFDFTISLCRIVDYFQWPKVSIIGHSMGAVQSYNFSVLFPERVKLLVCLDAFHATSRDFRKSEELRKDVLSFLKYDRYRESAEEPRSYTLESLPQLWHEGCHKSISVENCKFILERNIAPSKTKPGHFYFTRDPRMKTGIRNHISDSQLLEQAHRVEFPMCFLKADDNIFFYRTPILDELLNVIKKNSKDFQFIEVGGTHHVHLNNPERVGPLVHDFIKKHYSECAIDNKCLDLNVAN